MKKTLIIAGILLVFAVLAHGAPPAPNFFKQGMDHYNAGEYDAAIGCFQKVLNEGAGPNAQGQNPKKADAFYYIGMSMAKKGDPGGAIANFTKALNARPGYIQARLARGMAYVDAKNYDAAIDDLNAVVAAQPGNLDANFLLANSYSWQAKYPDAIRYYTKVLEINPNHAYAHYWIGLAYYKTNNVKQMIDHFERFLELAPDAPEAPQVKEVLKQVQG